VDGSIQPVAGSTQSVRMNLSASLFLSDPADYDGGELAIEDIFGQRSEKLAAGEQPVICCCTPSTSVHRGMLVARGARLASFFWIQSWCATMNSAPCSMSRIPSFRNSAAPEAHNMMKPCGWRASTITCCASGRSAKPR